MSGYPLVQHCHGRQSKTAGRSRLPPSFALGLTNPSAVGCVPGFSSAGYFLGFPPPALPFAAAGFAFLMPLDGGASTWFGSKLTLSHPLSSTRGLHPSSVRTEVPYCANRGAILCESRCHTVRAPRWPTDHFETSCLGEWHYCRDISPGHRRSVCWRESVRCAARRRAPSSLSRSTRRRTTRVGLASTGPSSS